MDSIKLEVEEAELVDKVCHKDSIHLLITVLADWALIQELQNRKLGLSNTL